MYMLTFDANDASWFPGYGFGVAATLAQNGPIVAEFDVDGHSGQQTMFGKTEINDGKWHLILPTYPPNLSTNSPFPRERTNLTAPRIVTTNSLPLLNFPPF